MALENRFLFPGHCVQMRNDSFAQVLLPRVLGQEDVDNDDARCALLATFVFVNPTRDNGNHPVLPIPYLKRGPCIFARIKDIMRRIQVVPIFRPGPGNSACVRFSRTFVVNPFVFKVRRGPMVPPVCLSCPKGCPGVGAPMPTNLGSYVRCPSCGHKFKWL
jgi:DNA-directed RNA polymerase subunit RPC12/RpoP